MIAFLLADANPLIFLPIVGLIAVALIVVFFMQYASRGPSATEDPVRTSTGDADVDEVLAKVLPEYRRLKRFFDPGHKVANQSEPQLVAAIAQWATNLRRNNTAFTPRLKQEMADTYLEFIWNASRTRFDQWTSSLVPRFLPKLEQAMPDVHEVYARELGKSLPTSDDRYRHRSDEERDVWLVGARRLDVACDLACHIHNLRPNSDTEIEQRFGEIVSVFQKYKDGQQAAERRAKDQAAERKRTHERERRDEEERQRTEAERLAVAQRNQQRQEEEHRERERLAAEAVARREAEIAGERLRRTELRHQVELTFMDHAADVKGVFGLGDLTAWQQRELHDDRSLPEIEAAVAAFSTLLKKYAAQRRLRSLYQELVEDVQESYTPAMLDEYIRAQLAVSKTLEEIVAAAQELESRLTALADRFKRERAIERLKATKREMQRRAEGVDALAGAIGEVQLFDEQEREELQRMALDAADRAKQSVFSDLLKKETGDVVRQFSREP